MKNIVIVAIATLGLVACGSGRKNAGENAKEAAKDPALQDKAFQGECKLGATDALKGAINSILNGQGLTASPKSYRTEYNFKGAKVTRKTVSYVTTDCSKDELLVQSEEGDVTVNPNGTTADGGKSLTMVFDTLKVTARGDAGVTFANGVKLCDKTDWSANKEETETDKAQNANCYGGSKLKRTVYAVYKVDGNKLTLNPDTMSEMTAENKRPTSLKEGTTFEVPKK